MQSAAQVTRQHFLSDRKKIAVENVVNCSQLRRAIPDMLGVTLLLLLQQKYYVTLPLLLLLLLPLLALLLMLMCPALPYLHIAAAIAQYSMPTLKYDSLL